jgi:hypothetical protein
MKFLLSELMKIMLQMVTLIHANGIATLRLYCTTWKDKWVEP